MAGWESFGEVSLARTKSRVPPPFPGYFSKICFRSADMSLAAEGCWAKAICPVSSWASRAMVAPALEISVASGRSKSALVLCKTSAMMRIPSGRVGAELTRSAARASANCCRAVRRLLKWASRSARALAMAGRISSGAQVRCSAASRRH